MRRRVAALLNLKDRRVAMDQTVGQIGGAGVAGVIRHGFNRNIGEPGVLDMRADHVMVVPAEWDGEELRRIGGEKPPMVSCAKATIGLRSSESQTLKASKPPGFKTRIASRKPSA